MSKIYGSLITKNEEGWLEISLSSMAWLEKVFLVDNSSSDKTLEIANSFPNVITRTVRINNIHPSAQQRNISIDGLDKDAWVLFMDADEYITKELKDEILRATQRPSIGAYKIPRINYFLGSEVRHGGWFPDYQVRLIQLKYLDAWIHGPLDLPQVIFSREFSKYKGSKYGPHDKPLLKDGTSVGILNNPYLHFTHRSISEMLVKSDKFLNSEIEFLKENSLLCSPSTIEFFVKPMREFIRRFIYHKGFLDGRVGLIESFYPAFMEFMMLAKKWEAVQQPPLDLKYKKYKKFYIKSLDKK